MERVALRRLVRRTNNFFITRWADVPVLQNVLDLWTIQETISELRPQLLIEIGTLSGGSAHFYATVMDVIGQGSVITVDISDRPTIEHARITFLRGDSVDPEIVATVRDAAEEAEGPVMVILDGNHARDHVARELELYSPMVTPGSYLLSQDGVIDELSEFAEHRPGPLEANRKFLATHDEFDHDRERNERYGLSYHPLGWMRRR